MKYQHGVDNIHLADSLLLGKKIGLVTNYTGVDSHFRRTVDILHRRYDLVRIFSPEHGLDGVAQAGVHVSNCTDLKTGLPIFSMYGENMDSDTLFDGIEAVAFDIQDIGVRFYTYISVLARAMKLCAKCGIPMVVLDRYNPLGLTKVSGTLLDETYSSFVGMYELPSRHAMTVGEYAQYINVEKAIHCQLHVIPCTNLSRTDDYRSLQVPWIYPSPNIPTFDTAVLYTGTVVFEGTNVSEGRGTTKPFELIGAPWIDGETLAEHMNAQALPGVHFRPAAFSPVFSKYQGERCEGVQIHITDHDTVEPFYCGLLLMDTIRKCCPQFEINPSLKRLLGTDEFESESFDLDRFVEKHKRKVEAFGARMKQYHIYERVSSV